mmetsp:Transcript_14921/g.59827  ORF Transcript_14921/g.59827 Transcript_14921/m.59827 type:complete len:333 (-) Transcript_14921:249-1247(-)
MLKTTALAWRMGESSRGQAVAAMAASTARPLPLPWPMPMSAVPASAMMARTSAKSTLMRPGLTMISEIPMMPCRRTSSATKNASETGVFAGTIESSLSFEMTMSVSTSRSSASMPSIAWRMRLRPSKPNGLVTTPTVSAPHALAAAATTGAAPVPVPPPMPAVTKTMSAPLTMLAISDDDSIAACLPTDGSPPAPSPRVRSRPMCSRPSHRAPVSACASVLTDQKSTPRTPVSTMRLIALQPPPPTPTTLISHGRSCDGSVSRRSPGGPDDDDDEPPLPTGFTLSVLDEACWPPSFAAWAAWADAVGTAARARRGRSRHRVVVCCWDDRGPS